MLYLYLWLKVLGNGAGITWLLGNGTGSTWVFRDFGLPTCQAHYVGSV